MRRFLLALPMLLALASCANEAPEPQVLSRQIEPIAGGVNDNQHKSVFGMFAANGGMCTGTLIAPNLILTARHCVAKVSGAYVTCGSSPFGATFSPNSVYVTADEELGYNSEFYRAAEIFVPSEGNDTCGFDVAMVRLTTSVEPSVAEPYIPRVDRMVRAGEIYTAVGYGNINDNNGAGRRRMRENLKVACGQGDCPVYRGATQSEWGGDTGICSGDSGGPALDADGQVVGVVSRGGMGCTYPVYGGVAYWGDWIREIALDAAEKGGYEPADWVTSGTTNPGSGGTGGAGGSGGGSGGAAGGSQSSGGTGGSSQNEELGSTGDACTSGDVCESGICATLGGRDEAICTTECSDSSECGDGFSCAKNGHCFPEAEVAAGEAGGSGVSASCSLSAPQRDPAQPVPWAVGLLGLGAFLVRRRSPRA